MAQDSASLLPHVSSVKGEIGLYGHHTHGLTVLTTAVFAVGEMAGSGVLALPAALNGTGYIGILLNVMCAIVSAYTGMLLGRCWLMVLHRYSEYQEHSRYPYPAIGQVTFGKPGRLIVSCAINFTLFGVSVVFLLLASENIQSLIQDAGANISFCYWLLIVAGCLLPITWLGTPKDFWPIAVGAVVATSVACCVILANIAEDSKTLPPAFYPKIDFKGFFFAFGTICFAFGGHPAFPTFQADMRNPEKFGKAIFIAYMSFSYKRVIFRTAMMAVILFVAESIPHFGAILSLVGGSTTTLLAYILPPVFYLKLCSMEGSWEKVTASLHEKVACAEIIAIGAVAGIASTYSAISDLATSSFSKPCYV
ncbi:uncharacterized protein LOC106050588 isoform X2 [Biomphalaria glabrata]|uniref:Uncharacterized protein LOC106050588 isoform X2 n=1 Tax=Biomphalaria glabrata TaxID=6526 RepID=A0A9W3APJ0_BIOGL|nr:uncharacterized protein LOC106050588 isoform X2 [Biomphalaria glabrata]